VTGRSSAIKARKDAGTLDAARIGRGSASRDGGGWGEAEAGLESSIEDARTADKCCSGSSPVGGAPNCGNSASSPASCRAILCELRAADGDTD